MLSFILLLLVFQTKKKKATKNFWLQVTEEVAVLDNYIYSTYVRNLISSKKPKHTLVHAHLSRFEILH